MRAFLIVGVWAVWNHGLAAQCPDGSPPPCTRAMTRGPAPNSVAVLYFDNLSRDTADAYLADGLTEEIIIQLGQVQRLEVKSRFESQRFRGQGPPWTLCSPPEPRATTIRWHWPAHTPHLETSIMAWIV